MSHTIKTYPCGCTFGFGKFLCKEHKHIERWINYWYQKGKASGWTAHVEKYESWLIKRDLLYGEDTNK